MKNDTIESVRASTTLCPNNDGTVTAIYADGERHAMETGSDESQALQFVLERLQGVGGTAPRREWLRLCTPCNKRAASAPTNEVEVCLDCAKSIDDWKESQKRWIKDRKRKVRNKRKQRRKQL